MRAEDEKLELNRNRRAAKRLGIEFKEPPLKGSCEHCDGMKFDDLEIVSVSQANWLFMLARVRFVSIEPPLEDQLGDRLCWSEGKSWELQAYLL